MLLPASQPIVRRKLADEVRERLLTLIRSGELSPGDRLPSERDLMERFGVGRPAVREALQSLGSAGLIEIHHGERARVAQPDTRSMLYRIGDTMLHLLQTSPSTLDDLKDALLMFEAGMAKIAAKNANAEDIKTLEAALQHQRDSISDIPVFVKGDMAFHRAIAAITRNKIGRAHV